MKKSNGVWNRPSAPSSGCLLLRLPPRIDALSVVLEDFLPFRCIEGRVALYVALGVVVVLAGLRIDAAHRAYHLGSEQDVLDGNHLEQQVDARLVIDAGVEEDVLQQMV